MTIFGIKIMVKSGLEKNILKFQVPLQSCCCPVQKNLPRRAELAWLVSRYLWRGTWNFKIIFSRPLFTITFKPKMDISRLQDFSPLIMAVLSGVNYCEKKYLPTSNKNSLFIADSVVSEPFWKILVHSVPPL